MSKRGRDVLLAKRLAECGQPELAREVLAPYRGDGRPLAAIEVTLPTWLDDEPTVPIRYVTREEIAAIESERLRELRRIPRGCASCGLYDHELPPCGADCACLCHERLSEAVSRLGSETD